MLQIVQCNDQSCCKFHTNYLTYFPERFLPPSKPLSLWLMDWKFLKECLDHFFEPSFEWNMWTNALTSFVPLCRRWAKKGKALSKEAHVGSVVNTTQPSRQWTLTKEGVIGMKMKATMKSLSWWKLIKNLTSLGWGSSSWQVLTRGEGGGG